MTHVERNGAPRLFVDPVAGALRLIIAGAGHIAQPLATFGKLLGFKVTVIDDRASFANRERFPTADEIIVRPFGAAIESLKLDAYCYLVAVTRGHAFDEEVLRAALKTAQWRFHRDDRFAPARARDPRAHRRGRRPRIRA